MNDETKDTGPQSAPASTTAGSPNKAKAASKAKPRPSASKPKAPAPAPAPGHDQEAPPAPAAPKEHHRPERVRIIIASDGTATGKDDVFASDGQGGQYLIKRDVAVSVPYGVYHGLTLAVNSVHQTDSNGSIIGTQKVPRFNIMLV